MLRRRNRQPSVVVTFHTTAEAMAMERACLQQGVPGRLVSAPRELTSDCGIAWVSPQEEEEKLRSALREAGIDFDGITCMEY